MQTILMPIDFSDATDRTVDFVAPFAEQLDAGLSVLHVSEAGLDDPKQDRAVLQPRVDAVVKKLEAKGCRASAHLVFGPPAASILEYIDAHSPTLVVMGSHGHTALYDLVMGSVAHRVLRSGKCPVLIVPPPPAAWGPSRESLDAGAMSDFYGFPGM